MTKVHGLFNFVKGMYSNDSSCNMQTQRHVQKIQVSISVPLSQTLIPKYWYRFLKGDIGASLLSSVREVVWTSSNYKYSIPTCFARRCTT